jgi:hypothetical protein
MVIAISEKFFPFFLRVPSTAHMCACQQQMIPFHLKFATIRSSGLSSRIVSALWMAVISIVHLLHISDQPTETVKGSCLKTAYLGAHLISHSFMPLLVGRAQQQMLAFTKTPDLLTWIFPKASITLAMQGIHCPANSLFHTVACGITLLNGAVRVSGMFSPFI